MDNVTMKKVYKLPLATRVATSQSRSIDTRNIYGRSIDNILPLYREIYYLWSQGYGRRAMVAVNQQGAYVLRAGAYISVPNKLDNALRGNVLMRSVD